MKLKTSDIAYISIGVAFTAISGTVLKIPSPFSPVDFSLQTLFVLLFPLLIGKKAAITQIVYLTLGLIGLPIFTKGGGVSYVLQPSFGYLVGFIVSSFVVGSISEKVKVKEKQTPKLILASLLGLLVIYTFGVLYMSFILNVYGKSDYSIGTILMFGVVYYLPIDIFSAVISAFIAKALNKAFKAVY